MNLTNITLLNLKSRFDSYGATMTDGQILAWNDTTARFEPHSLKTVGGTSLLGSGNISTGDAPTIYVADLVTTIETALSGVQTIDGVSATDKTVLVMGNSDPITNGLYYVDGLGTWTRAATGTEMFGRYIFISDGLLMKNKFYKNNNVIVPATGTDAVTFFELDFQQKLVSGTNIKTVNGNSLLGSGDLTVSATPLAFGNIITNLTLETNASAGDVMYLKATGTLVACKGNSASTNLKLGILAESGLAGEAKPIASFGSIFEGTNFGTFTAGTTYYIAADKMTITSTVNGTAFAKCVAAGKLYIMEP